GTNTRGGCVATGICETIGVDEVTFWVVGESIVNVAGVIDVADAAVIAGIGPSCKTTGGKANADNVESEGADTAVGTR
ncbi:hypothetical protein KI387_022227, partial [Taxus chinensis]